jgi:hypothetical protein
MVWFYARGQERRSCETRLALVGDGYELVVREGRKAWAESFTELPKLLAREHELLAAWKAQGWTNEHGTYAAVRSDSAERKDGPEASSPSRRFP